MNPLNPMYPGGGGGGGNNGLGAPPMNLPTMNEFNSADIVSGSKSFLDSNSYVAKAAYLFTF